MRRTRALPTAALAAALAGGCALAGGAGGLAGAPLVFKRGEVEPGRYLVTVVVTREGCSAGEGACTTYDNGTVHAILPRSPDTDDWVYEAYAHELCHVVAGLRGMIGAADPCHKEDGGRMHAVRGPFRGSANRPR